jgi:uncharacterized membrane protein YfcA
VSHPFAVALIGFVSLLYATAGQAGGTAFLAVMAFAAFPATEMRATALLLNIVAAGYATWQLHRRAAIDRKVLLPFKQTADTATARPVRLGPAAAVGAGAGFISGLTGVGGGVFLTPVLIALGWATPKREAQLSPPFILCNSILGLAGILLAGQQPAPGTFVYSLAALAGAVIGTAIGRRWMSERGTRYVLAVILLFAGIRLLFR